MLEVFSAGYNGAYLYFGLVDHTTSSITESALLIEFVYRVDIFNAGKISFSLLTLAISTCFRIFGWMERILAFKLINMCVCV